MTPNLFALLGVSAFRGRTLAPGDETAGVKPVVLSYRLWQSSFGGASSVVGRSVKLGAEAYTVVGIMPPQFVFPPRISLASDVKAGDCDLWVPHSRRRPHDPEEQGGQQPPHIDDSKRSKGVPNASQETR